MTELHQYVAQIIDDNTGEVVHQSKPTSLRRADRLEDGYAINLDHDNYSTRVLHVRCELCEKP